MAIRIDEYGHIIRDDSDQNNQNPQNGTTSTGSASPSGDRLFVMPNSTQMESDSSVVSSPSASLERPQSRKYWVIGIIALLAIILLIRSCSNSIPKSSVEITTSDTTIGVGETIQVSIRSSTSRVTANYNSSLIELDWANTTQKKWFLLYLCKCYWLGSWNCQSENLCDGK